MNHLSDRNLKKGFTLAELMVASVICSVVLIGVYHLFYQAVKAAEKMTLAMHQRACAEQAVDFLAEELARCINLKNIETIRAGNDEESFVLEITTVGRGFSGNDVNAGAVLRQRFVCKPDPLQNGYDVSRQVMVYAGSANLLFPDESQADWSALPASIIFRQLNALDMEFLRTDQPSYGWQKEYQGMSGRVAVRIRAVSGNQVCQRIVLPAACAVLE